MTHHQVHLHHAKKRKVTRICSSVVEHKNLIQGFKKDFHNEAKQKNKVKNKANLSYSGFAATHSCVLFHLVSSTTQQIIFDLYLNK
jgi:hypothetical protein